MPDLPSEFDEIKYWSEVKLDIVRKYAGAYSRILSAQQHPPLAHYYIDAFAGPGMHFSTTTEQFVPGSPLNALHVEPPFKHYYFIDLKPERVKQLRALAAPYPNVSIYEGDCNEVLVNEVFPKIKYEDYRRGLCILDPYGLHLDWKILATAGTMQSIDIFLNFPVMDMNRNVLWRNPDKAKPDQKARMTRFWGDDSWREVAYDRTGNLFGYEEKTDNETIAEAFGLRLKNVAGFKYVSAPLPMRNQSGATVYYLYFASQKPVALEIIEDIFGQYRERSA